MAERVGFEPTLEFPLNTLSKRAPSATRPSLRLTAFRGSGRFLRKARGFDSPLVRASLIVWRPWGTRNRPARHLLLLFLFLVQMLRQVILDAHL